MYNNITIIIVTYYSEHIIKKTLNKLSKFRVIIIENSKNLLFKKFLENRYKNVKCIIPNQNLGFGRAVNLGIKLSKTKYCLILNPDAFTNDNTIQKLYLACEKNKKIAAISANTKINKNFGYFIFSNNKKINQKKNIVNVDFFVGHTYLISKNIIKKIGYFDKKIFLNFEEIDLFKRLAAAKYEICLYKNVYCKHLSGMSHYGHENINLEKEIKYTFKWHYAWGYYYFYKKHYNFFISNFFFLKFLFKSIIQFIYFFFKYDKIRLYYILASIYGLTCSYTGKQSFYRPKLKNENL